tara:strand:- start:67 stop:375 length:309 start_codon:yes stop_codon:yes gene_type:complete
MNVQIHYTGPQVFVEMENNGKLYQVGKIIEDSVLSEKKFCFVLDTQHEDGVLAAESNTWAGLKRLIPFIVGDYLKITRRDDNDEPTPPSVLAARNLVKDILK